MSKDYIKTFTGKYVDPFNLRPEDIDIVDIAHSLSLLNRYNGHTFYPFTVAQHSLAISRECSKKAKLWALLHDATEAYIGDMPSPIKHRLPDFLKLEKRVEEAIITKFNLELTKEIEEEVHHHDKEIVQYEKAMYLKNYNNKVFTVCNPIYRGLTYRPWGCLESKSNFLSEYNKLV